MHAMWNFYWLLFESGDLELLSEEEVMEINGGCGSVGPAPDSGNDLGNYYKTRTEARRELAESVWDSITSPFRD